MKRSVMANFLLLSCFSPQFKKAKVIQPDGLALKDRPSMNGKQLALMKEKEEVLVQRDDGPEETLYGRKSRWFEVEYKGINGYAFGGLLEYTVKGRRVSVAASTSKNFPKTITNSIGMEFVLIPAGEFIIGCSSGDRDCENIEKPQHNVKITKPFYMGKYEVTQEQWEVAMWNRPSHFNHCGDDCPVEKVSWEDVQEFIGKLHSLGQGRYRLPTEAEWEYAARAGRGSARYGNLDSIAWYEKNSNGKSNMAGKKLPNAFGLYDMLGNVWEWVNDRYDENYDSRKIPDRERFSLSVIDPKGPETGSCRVLRGGYWGSAAQNIRVSSRNFSIPDGRYISVGFRLVFLPED